jgi:hypothetical protein
LIVQQITQHVMRALLNDDVNLTALTSPLHNPATNQPGMHVNFLEETCGIVECVPSIRVRAFATLLLPVRSKHQLRARLQPQPGRAYACTTTGP